MLCNLFKIFTIMYKFRRQHEHCTLFSVCPHSICQWQGNCLLQKLFIIFLSYFQGKSNGTPQQLLFFFSCFILTSVEAASRLSRFIWKQTLFAMFTTKYWFKTFKWNALTCALDKAKPLLPDLDPDYALVPQFRVDGGKLSPNCEVVDHFLDKTAQISSSYLIFIKVSQSSHDCIFTLVALCRATSAKLQDFDEDICAASEALQRSFV